MEVDCAEAAVAPGGRARGRSAMVLTWKGYGGGFVGAGSGGVVPIKTVSDFKL